MLPYYAVNTTNAGLEKKRPYTKQLRQNKDKDNANPRQLARCQYPAILNRRSRAV